MEPVLGVGRRRFLEGFLLPQLKEENEAPPAVPEALRWGSREHRCSSFSRLAPLSPQGRPQPQSLQASRKWGRGSQGERHCSSFPRPVGEGIQGSIQNLISKPQESTIYPWTKENDLSCMLRTYKTLVFLLTVKIWLVKYVNFLSVSLFLCQLRLDYFEQGGGICHSIMWLLLMIGRQEMVSL